MKNLTNILSYLWLLLLMAVTACSDLEEEVGPMHVEEEVELNIQLHVPDMQASTREEMVITENISSIVAIAFDESGALIKKVDAILSDQDHENHNGKLKIKVPKRTQTIHFLGNYTKNDIEESITSLETLNSFATTDDTTMRYWGKADYNGGNDLSVTLYRNMAKLTLTKGKNLNGSCYIAGFVNRNLSGTVVPNDYVVGDTPTIPNNVGKGSYEADNSLGNVYYLFEHANDKNNPLYVIIEVKDKYYKVAFASGDTYFPILRNRAYEITVTEPLDEMYAEADYTAAVNSQYPINDLVITSVSMTVTASPTEVLNQSGQTCTVTVTIPEGITELNVPEHDDFTITPPNGLTAQNGKYTVTPGSRYEFTLTVKEGVTAGNKTIFFSGRGKYLKATGSASIGLYDNVQLTVTADPATIYNTAGSTRNVAVSVPQGITTLTIPSATTDAFIVTPQNGLSANNDGSYTVSAGDYLFTLQLRTDGDVGSTKTVTFNGSGQYKRATGSTTLTLVQAPAQEILSEYELWVENSAWKGSTNYDTFFTWNGDISAGDASNLESTFYDDGANAHISRHMVMGQNNSISFTIPDTRYLTLLVASNNGNTPSINLTGTLTDDTWATATSEDDVVPDNYNFGKGEIGTNGRLICYTLPADTYTLQGSSTSYLLYYLRVSTEKPTMTDIVQPTVSDYSLSWSGGEWGNWTYVENGNLYVVDDDAKTFTLTYTGLGLTEGTLTLNSLSLNVSNSVMNNHNANYSNTNNSSSVAISDINAGTYTYTIGSGEISNPTYKYSNFYDKIALKAVNGNGSATVKHSVKLKLTNGDIYQDASKVVDYYDLSLTDPRLAICTPETRINTGGAFNFTITENWTYRGATNKTLNGIPLMAQNGTTFTIADVDESGTDDNGNYTWEHPFWYTYIYYLDWGSFADTSNANRSLSTMTISTSTDDTDIWFSYKNQGISKSMVINVNQNPGEVVEPEGFQVSLDFYQSDSNNQGNGATYNLQAGITPFHLKATISEADAQNYKNETVYLKGMFNGNGNTYGNSNGGIHWTNSRNSGNSSIGYYGDNSDGTGLQFTIVEGKTVYDIEWVFVTGSNYTGSGDIGFTYTIAVADDSPVKYSLSNESETNAILNIDILDIELDFYVNSADGGSGQYTNSNLVFGETNFYLKATIPEGVPAGTKIELDMAIGGDINGIHQFYSYNESYSEGMDYRWGDGGVTGLVITTEAGKTDYYMCWTYVRSDNVNTSSVNITYALSANNYCNLSGETSADIAITGNHKQIQVAAYEMAAAGKIIVPLAYGTGTTEEFTVDVTVPAGVTGISIAAEDFYVAWSNGNGAVSNSTTYTFAESQETQTKRFKFTLKETSKGTKETSTITFSCNDKYIASGVVTVNLSQRAADTDGGTTIWSGLAQLEWSVNYLSIPNTIAKGSTVRLNFATTGGAFKLHDGEGQAFKLSNEDYSHQQNNDTYLNVSSGQTYYEFEVDNINEGTEITDGLQGLKVNGNNITMTSIVVKYPVIYCNFDNNSLDGFFSKGEGSVSSNGALVLTNNTEECENPWDAQAMIATDKMVYGGTYTLTFKAKIEGGTTGGLIVAIQHIVNDDTNYTYFYSGNRNVQTYIDDNKNSEGWAQFSYDITIRDTNNQETPNTNNPTHFMFNFGDINGTIYIDDLKLVEKTN